MRRNQRISGELKLSTGNEWLGPLSLIERRHASDVLLAMIFKIIAAGAFVRDLSSFLNLLSYCLDSEWDESSREMGEKKEIQRTGPRGERYRFAVKGCTVLLLLLQIKPHVPNLYESFAQCCGSIEGAAGWILCAIVNSFDDTIRSLGMQCIVAFTETTAKSPDSPLSFGTPSDSEAPRSTPTDGSRANRRIQSLLAVGKGLAGMGPGVKSIALPPSRLTARVTYKLMWHLLKGHRSRFGMKSCEALIYLAVDEAETLLSSSHSKASILDTFVVPDNVLRGGYQINITPDVCSLIPGQSIRDGLGISTVMRLLRFLSSEMKDKLLATLLRLVVNDVSSVITLSSLPDWQPCLFHLISETLERFNVGRSNDTATRLATNVDFLDEMDDGEVSMPSEIIEAAVTLEARLDLCLDLYANLLGHCVREGGDKVNRGADFTTLCHVFGIYIINTVYAFCTGPPICRRCSITSACLPEWPRCFILDL